MYCNCENIYLVADSGKSKSMEEKLLIELKVDACRWKTLYRCRYCKELWEESFLEDRFIGNPQLVKVDRDYVKKEWGKEFI